MSEHEQQPQETNWPEEPPRLTAEQKKEFFEDFLSGRIVSDRQMKSGEDVLAVFMVLALSTKPPESFLNKLAMVYERLDKAGPLSMNGLPMFMSCSFMHQDDWDELKPKLLAELKRRLQAADEV